MEYYEFRAMNSNIVLAAEGQARALEAGFEHARAFIENCEGRFTRFREDSELSQLNRASGRWFYASPELYSVVREALDYVDETDGLFDPSILEALERAGYDRSLDEIRAHGPGEPGGYPSERAGRFSLVEFDEAAQAIYLPAGLRIDLGGIAKGWSAERAAQELAEFTPACVVNAGGDLYAIGMPAG